MRILLFLLNFLILQWFCIRLVRKAVHDPKRKRFFVGQYTWLTWVKPLSGFWTPYKDLKKVSVKELSDFYKTCSKNQIVAEIIALSFKAGKNKNPMAYRGELKTQSKKTLIKTLMVMKVYQATSNKLDKATKENTMKILEEVNAKA